MKSFESHIDDVIKQQWGTVIYSTGVKYSQSGQKYALIINRVIWYALRIIVEVDERCDGRPEVYKLDEFLTQTGAYQGKDYAIARMDRIKDDPLSCIAWIKNPRTDELCEDYKVEYYLKIPADVREYPDKYLKPGDYVLAKRFHGIYNHAGIYAGNSTIIHISVPEDVQGDGKFKQESCVIKTSWSKFYGDKKTEIKVFFKLFRRNSQSDVLATAEGLIGSREGQYNFFKKNCQHFCSYCLDGSANSPEVSAFFENSFCIVKDYKKE